MTVIRAAAAADVPQAAIVKARGWRTSYAEAVPPDFLAVFSDPGHWLTAMKRSLGSPEDFLLVADDGTAVVGMAQGTFAPEPYLASLHVVPERRNQGIGALLMAHVARTAMDRGLTPCSWTLWQPTSARSPSTNDWELSPRENTPPRGQAA